MFTYCPDCSSVYEISAEQLGAASGLVRCGNCSATFSALRRLTETPPDFSNASIAGVSNPQALTAPQAPSAPESTDNSADNVEPATAESSASVSQHRDETPDSESAVTPGESDPTAPASDDTATPAAAAPGPEDAEPELQNTKDAHVTPADEPSVDGDHEKASTASDSADSAQPQVDANADLPFDADIDELDDSQELPVSAADVDTESRHDPATSDPSDEAAADERENSAVAPAGETVVVNADNSAEPDTSTADASAVNDGTEEAVSELAPENEAGDSVSVDESVPEKIPKQTDTVPTEPLEEWDTDEGAQDLELLLADEALLDRDTRESADDDTEGGSVHEDGADDPDSLIANNEVSPTAENAEVESIDATDKTDTSEDFAAADDNSENENNSDDQERDSYTAEKTATPESSDTDETGTHANESGRERANDTPHSADETLDGEPGDTTGASDALLEERDAPDNSADSDAMDAQEDTGDEKAADEFDPDTATGDGEATDESDPDTAAGVEENADEADNIADSDAMDAQEDTGDEEATDESDPDTATGDEEAADESDPDTATGDEEAADEFDPDTAKGDEEAADESDPDTATGDEHETDKDGLTDDEVTDEATDDTVTDQEEKDAAVDILMTDVDGTFDSQLDEKRDLRDLSHYLKPGKSVARRIGESSVLLLLVVLLGMQFVHHNRAVLVNHPKFGGYLQASYTALGLEVDIPQSADDYRVARHTIVPDAEDQNTLMARATIVNNSPQPRPLPLVRLELRNRWGDAIFARIFAPDDYLHGTAPARMAGNGRLEVALDIINPTDEIDIGYSFDICVTGPDGRPNCEKSAIFE